MSEIDWSKAPEGVTHAGARRNGIPCWYKFSDKWYYLYPEYMGGWRECDSHPQHEPLIPRPTKPEGVDGLPPVGSKVRFPTGHGEVVLGPDVNGVLIVERENGSDKGAWVKVAASACEPLRTPEERQREELCHLIADNMKVIYQDTVTFNIDLGPAVDAILSKYNLTEK